MSRLRTVSLRRRVTLTAVAVVAAVLVGVAFVVTVLFGLALDRGLNGVLADRVQLARQLAGQGVDPALLIHRVDDRAVRARLVLPDGRTYGSLRPRAAEDPIARLRRVRLRGPGEVDGAVLTVSADTPLLDGAQAQLLRLLLFTGLGALLVVGIALLVGMRFALAPLDAMTSLARSTARGDRGARLSPARADTELGRTAAAFDEMLDALEGAEARAKASDERTRRFVADAAHELRTPISGVAAVAEAVLHQPADTDPEERERLHLLLVRESRRAGKLVEDLLDLARLDADPRLHRERIDLHALCAAQADRVRALHPELSVELSGAELPVDADPDRVGQVLANVVDNACQATPPGGRVRIATSRVDGFAEVLVTDTGPGVPAAERERIFDRLVRLDAARDRRDGGSGLGLAIARGFARAHGGELTCEDPGEAPGAAFRLRLPISPQPAAGVSRGRASSRPAGRTG